MQDGSSNVNCVLLLDGRMPYVVCSTDKSVPRGNTATSCMFFETLETNSGRPTGTSHRGGTAEKGGIQSDAATDRGGREAHRGPKDPTAEWTGGNDGGAQVERGGVKKGGPGLTAVTKEARGTKAEVQTGKGRGVVVGIET